MSSCAFYRDCCHESSRPARLLQPLPSGSTARSRRKFSPGAFAWLGAKLIGSAPPFPVSISQILRVGMGNTAGLLTLSCFYDMISANSLG